MPEAPSQRVVLVVIAQEKYDFWESLDEVAKATSDLADALATAGYQLLLSHLRVGGTRDEIVTALGGLLNGLGEKDRLFIYWAGHGTGSRPYYLVTKESPRPDPTSLNAITADQLGELVAKSKAEKVLLILDTCYSSAGAQAIAVEVGAIWNQQTWQPGQERFIHVLPSAHSLQKAQEAVFCRTLVNVLLGSDARVRKWGDDAEWIEVGQLRDSVVRALRKELGDSWQPPMPIEHGYGGDFLPNPRYRGPRPVMDVESGRRTLEIPDPLDQAARGIEFGESGFYFKGRTHVLTEIASWLRDGTGLMVLTGPPGSGKSAVVGRVVVLSDPAARALAKSSGSLDGVPDESLPPLRSVDMALHVKGLSLPEFARAIGQKAGLDLSIGASFDQQSFVEQVKNLNRPVTLGVDALDEASEPWQIGLLLRRLVEDANARVLIGTRRSPDGRTLRAGSDRHALLIDLFGEGATIVDLGDESDSQADIAAYVVARLKDPSSRHRGNNDAILDAARLVAERAQGVFLYARVVSRTMQDASTLDISLPEGPAEAFAQDLSIRFKEHRSLVDDLLRALAWAEGGGLSRQAWILVASAVSPGETMYDDTDVAWVLDNAGVHILETGEAGQTVYRLAHQSFADQYQSQVEDRGSIQQRITSALAGGALL